MNWIIKSSANPEETSATVKGILMQYVGLMVSVLTILNLNVGSEVIVNYISTSTVLLGALLTTFGLARKMYYTLK